MADKKTTKAKVAKATEVKTVEQMQQELAAKTADIMQAKRGHAAGELTNPRAITALRKDIARLNTAIRAAQLDELKEKK